MTVITRFRTLWSDEVLKLVQEAMSFHLSDSKLQAVACSCLYWMAQENYEACLKLGFLDNVKAALINNPLNEEVYLVTTSAFILISVLVLISILLGREDSSSQLSKLRQGSLVGLPLVLHWAVHGIQDSGLLISGIPIELSLDFSSFQSDCCEPMEDCAGRCRLGRCLYQGEGRRRTL